MGSVMIRLPGKIVIVFSFFSFFSFFFVVFIVGLDTQHGRCQRLYHPHPTRTPVPGSIGIILPEQSHTHTSSIKEPWFIRLG